MSNKLDRQKTSYFDNKKVRILVDGHDKPWWVVKDILGLLGHDSNKNTSSIMGTYLDKDYEKKYRKLCTTSGETHEAIVVDIVDLEKLLKASKHSMADSILNWAIIDTTPDRILISLMTQEFIIRGHSVRGILDIDGELWAVGKDVCTAIEITDYHQALKRVAKNNRGMCVIHTPGGNQNMKFVNRPGAFTLVEDSNKSETQEFRNNLKSEVAHSMFPAVKGKAPPLVAEGVKVEVNEDKPASQEIDMSKLADQLSGTYRIGILAGLSEGTALDCANDTVTRLTGYNCLHLINYDKYKDRSNIRVIEPVEQDKLPQPSPAPLPTYDLTATQVGKTIIPKISAQEVNKLLKSAGYIVRDNITRWRITDKGKPYIYLRKKQLFYLNTIIEIINELYDIRNRSTIPDII